MIKLFKPIDKVFNSNGDVVIVPIKARVHKEDNGPFYLDLETDIKYANDLIEGNIIIAPTPQGEQAFRITNPQKTRSKISIRAYHVFYDSQNYLIDDSYVFEKNCNDALKHLNEATSDPSPFSTLSDVETISSYRCVRSSLYEAIKTVLDRWGGHILRDNFKIEIRNIIGQDNGVVIRYAKNLKEITCEQNWSNVVTKLLPVGKDGLLLNKLDPSADIYINSAIKYQIPYTKCVTFSQDNVLEDDYKDSKGDLNQEAYIKALLMDLRKQAQKYINENNVPKVNYTLKANIEKLTDVGDTVEVIDERLGINIFTHVISFEYDCILKEYTEIEFGNATNKLSNLVNNITNTATARVESLNQTIQVTLTKELKEVTDKIWGVLGDSYVIYDGNKILIVDRLPKETAQNVIMINSSGVGFSTTGINGTFTTAWGINGTLNMSAINVINLTANLIKGGTFKLGSNLNNLGQIEVYNEANKLIAEINKNGVKMYGVDNSYVLINENVGFAGYDRLNNAIFWCNNGNFNVKNNVVSDEVTLFNKFKIVPITLTDQSNTDGIGIINISI